MTIMLRPEIQRLIDERVQAGSYPSADSLVELAIVNFLREEAEDLEDLRREIQIGIDQAERGEFVEFTAEDVIAEGVAQLEQRRKKAI